MLFTQQLNATTQANGLFTAYTQPCLQHYLCFSHTIKHVSFHDLQRATGAAAPQFLVHKTVLVDAFMTAINMSSGICPLREWLERLAYPGINILQTLKGVVGQA